MTDPTAGVDGPAKSVAPVLLQVRPRRITIYAAIAASLVVLSMLVIGLLLLNSNEGVAFRASDQIGLIGVGLILGGLIMTAARPRLRADRNGLWVRNLFGDEFIPWPLVLRIAYPQGAPWAQLNMPDDESKPVMAIQAMDRGRAVQALEAVREVQAKYGPPPPARAPRVLPPGMSGEDDDSARDVRLGDSQNKLRPLGRLEIIDREKAAQRDRDAQAKQDKLARKSARRRSTG
ncbi:MAG: PH domain-containing protein [Nakamurella sp.]